MLCEVLNYFLYSQLLTILKIYGQRVENLLSFFFKREKIFFLKRLSFCRAALRNLPAQTHLLLNSATLREKSTPTTVYFSSVQSISHVQLFAIPCTAAHQASLSITNSQSLLKLTSIELVMPSNHLILCCPLLLLPSIFPSISVCSNESVLRIRWPKYLNFSFIISPSNEYSGLISFRIDWFNLLAVQGTLPIKSSEDIALTSQFGILPLLFTKTLLFPK